MKFKTTCKVQKSEEELQQDYEKAIRQEKVRMGEKCLYIGHTMYTEYVPYEAIDHAYRRIEEVRGKLCCGVTTYEIHHLVMEAGTKTITVMFESREAAQEVLDRIAFCNPGAKIGYRPNENAN